MGEPFILADVVWRTDDFGPSIVERWRAMTAEQRREWCREALEAENQQLARIEGRCDG